MYNVGDLDNYWTVTCVPPAFPSIPPYPAKVIRLSAWDGPLANSQWIGPHPVAQNPTNGVYCYEFSFCMTDTAGACLDLQMLVDDDAVVFLNGTKIFDCNPGPNPCDPQCFFEFPAQRILTCGQGHFRTPVNTLRIEVTNRYGVASGLNISGSVTAPGASLEQEWCCDSSGAIAGIKWEDDGNCQMDPGEPVLSGWTMQLSGPSGPLQTQTDNFGYYFFNNLTPGTYTVTEVIPPGWAATCPPSGSQSVVVPPHTVVSDINFGNRRKPCDPAPPGMVAWWPLDEDENATVVEDIAVNGYHPGTPSPHGQIGDGDPYYGPKPAYLWWPAGRGKVHGALYFWNQGIENRYISVTTKPDIEFGTIDFSIDAWVFINQYNATDLQPIVEKMHYDGTIPETGYRFYLENGLLSFTLVSGPGTAHTIRAPSPLTTNIWHHVAVTIDRDPVNPGATVSLFIDGTLAFGESAAYTTNIANNEDLFIGGSVLGNQINYLDLAIDEVELFDTVLTQDQIFSIVQADSFGKCKGYISGMKFHDHNGNGIKNSGDEGLANWTIFIDTDNDEVLDDPGETYTTTGTSGNYSFTVPPGWYKICEVNQSGWEQKLPLNPPYYNVGVQTDESVTDRDFGNYGCEPCSNNVVQNWSFTPDFVPWIVAYNTPDFMDGYAWCDLGKVGMWGNQVVGEAIHQTLDSPFDPGWCYAIKFDAVWAPAPGRPYPVQFEFRASYVPLTSPTDAAGVLIGVSLPVTPAQTWKSMPTIIWKATAAYTILTVSATNQSSAYHGDSTSYGAIDRICIYKFKVGDVNGDLQVDVGDVIYLINYLYRGGPAPFPIEGGDYNGDGVVDVGDVVYLINYLFKGGPPPGC